MPTVAFLQRRRAQLAKKYNARKASADRYLELALAALQAAKDVDTQILMVDRELNRAVDWQLNQVDTIQTESGEYENPM